MQAAWFKGCKTADQKEARRKQLESFRTAFEELSEILESKKKPSACRDYLEAGWANQQIAVNEYNHALNEVIKLITLTKE